MDRTLEERIREFEAILDIGARRYLESVGKFPPQPAAKKGGSEYAGRRVAAAPK